MTAIGMPDDLMLKTISQTTTAASRKLSYVLIAVRATAVRAFAAASNIGACTGLQALGGNDKLQ